MSKIMAAMEQKTYYGGVNFLERMKECKTPGVSIVEIENYNISNVYTYGFKRKRGKEEVNANTLFQAASVSKPVFAVGVMRLVEKGILDLDKDIAEYLGDYCVPTYDNQKYKITLRQILSHHAGLSLHGFPGYRKGQRIPTINQLIKGDYPAHLPPLKVVREPGTEYMYSGGGYVLAQKIVMDICRSDFNELMNELVFSPLSMEHSFFMQTVPKEMEKEIAFGYDYTNLQISGGYFIMPEFAAGGLWSTPSDLAKLGIEIMKALNGESNFLKKESAKTMTTKVNDKSIAGVGFRIEEIRGGKLFGHGGNNPGYHSAMWFCPCDGSGVVIMLNGDIGVVIVKEFLDAFKKVSGW